MRDRILRSVSAFLVVMMLGVSSVWAAKQKPAAPETPLTDRGNALLAEYTRIHNELKDEIIKALPVLDDTKKALYQQASEAKKTAEAEVSAAQKRVAGIEGAAALVNHAKGKWIGGAEKGIANAEEMLKKAATDAEREAARQELAKCQKSRDEGVKALEERQAAYDKAKLEEPKLLAELDAAKKKLELAQANMVKVIKELNVGSLLESDKLDGKLAKYTVIAEATPRGLAEFAQQGKEQELLIEKLLADEALMLQMAIADGAVEGKYGQAMKIYTEIQKASRKAAEGSLQRLALAVSLEHAVPIKQGNPQAKTDAPATVDPVKRYLHYEKAFLDGELDAGFKDLSVWDYRFVVDGEEPNEIAAWGREMLRNYRPDHIYTSDYRWRYVAAVKTEVKYGSKDNQYDEPELQSFQNILKNGGVCGRRAFFGRFILRAFGIPTTARPQKGHAALAHWTPDGWVICLGAGWGHGHTKTRYSNDLDFLANTQARMTGEPFKQVRRAQMIGSVLGETPVWGFNAGEPAFWHAVALYLQKDIIDKAQAVTLAAVGTDIGEANESKEKDIIEAVTMTEADRKVVVSGDGVITIPAAACSKPTQSTGKIIFMKSNLGGMQLHYSRNGTPEDFEYTFDAPAAGKYALSARVVTPSWKQHLQVAVNGAETPVDIALPFTVGKWDKTQPVEITLVKGRNVLKFSRNQDDGGLKGVTIKDFTLTPVK